MDPTVSAQLEKVLALADSSHDAEALQALRTARQLMARDGLRLSDLARGITKRPASGGIFSLFSNPPPSPSQTQIMQLQQKLDDLQVEIQAQHVQLEFWRKRSSEFEQHFHATRSEAERWRRMAQETVEKLWNLGQEIRAEDSPAGDAPKQKSA